VPVSADLIADIQTARLKLTSALQRRLWDLAAVLDRPRREVLKRAIAELDPWHVLSTRAVGPPGSVLPQWAKEPSLRMIVT
jgi:hypothetical protein